MACTQIKPITGLEEGILDGVRPHAGVIHTFHLVRKVRDDGIKTLGVPITTGQEALRSNLVPVAPPWGDECCDVSVSLTNGHRVIPVPGISHGLLGTLWDAIC